MRSFDRNATSGYRPLASKPYSSYYEIIDCFFFLYPPINQKTEKHVAYLENTKTSEIVASAVAPCRSWVEANPAALTSTMNVNNSPYTPWKAISNTAAVSTSIILSIY